MFYEDYAHTIYGIDISSHHNQVAAKEGVVRLRAGQDYTLR